MEKEEVVVLRMGQKIEYSGKVFILTCAEMVESPMGRGLKLIASDPDYAEKKQREGFDLEETRDSMLGAMKKLFEKGGFGSD